MVKHRVYVRHLEARQVSVRGSDYIDGYDAICRHFNNREGRMGAFLGGVCRGLD